MQLMRDAWKLIGETYEIHFKFIEFGATYSDPSTFLWHGQVSWILINPFIEGSLEVKLPTIWRDEKQSRAEAERRGRLEERRSEEKE